MSALTDLYIKKDVLKTLLDTLEKKGDNGISITISISDEPNQYNQNVSSFVSQTKEQREAKANKFYIGNGRVVWTDGKIVKVDYQPKPEQTGTAQADVSNTGEGDLPF
jgi:hypothetical protein